MKKKLKSMWKPLILGQVYKKNDRKVISDKKKGKKLSPFCLKKDKKKKKPQKS